ncbi:hypothetical protein PPL_07254 [Heterostelium album PN500]|uniref:Uncharacterized protein n=1 Tax=Heterostelium pallidum (strain ATCC 26659 / Pp 5 / PN500) TaxID=670386 RepID=D3BET9_HETP5|nr:hypothetical protein PPL_07254 [Heterostelium album PN500]EFA80420.1 hypothetical protein PPL_07254 [Heterostelium album PN500]|eukprot:XP_020432540.1 hypothetical protein PPL_07254 [Heterostelium album PN500]
MTSFIQDYKTWRVNLMKTNGSGAGNTSYIPSLTPANFMLRSTFKVVDGVKQDVVKEESESYFARILLYHLSDDGLAVLKVSRPTLDDDISKILQSDSGFVAKITKYAKLWLLGSIFQQKSNDKSIPCEVKGDVVQAEFKQIQSDPLILSLKMRLAFLAICRKAPEFLPYAYQVDSLQLVSKVRTYLLDDTYKNNWVRSNFDRLKSKMNDNTAKDDEVFNELKTKLDILDPSYSLSNEITNTYYSSLLVLFGSISLKDTPATRLLFKRMTQDALQKIEANPKHEWYETVVWAKKQFQGNIASMANQISRAMMESLSGSQWRLGGASVDNILTLENARYIGKLQKIANASGVSLSREAYEKFKNNKNFFRMSSAIFLMCNAAGIYAAFRSWDKLTTVEKVLTWVNVGLSGVDVITSLVELFAPYKITDGILTKRNVFTWIGSKFKKLTPSRVTPYRAANLARNTSKWSKYMKPVKVLRAVSVVLIVVSMGFTIYDIVTAVNDQDWGMLTLSVAEFALELGLLIATVITAWTGPICLALTVALVVVGVMKMFWEDIKQFFVNTYNTIHDFFNDLFNGSPTGRYVRSVQSQYQLTTAEYLAKWKELNNVKPNSDADQLITAMMNMARANEK